MSLSINQTPAKTVSTPEGVSLYTSMWTAVHNPIVFKLASTLFPVAELGNTVTFVTVSESALGNAVLTWSTNPDVPPSDLVPGLYIKIEGAVYSGEYQIVNYGAASNTLEINTPFISTDTGTIQRAYRNYVVDLKVFAGLPASHKWKALKPEIEVETLQQIPNASNVAVFDIQEAVKQQVNTKNDLSQVCAPNDVNLWSGFRVAYQESYNTYEGVIGVSDLITAAADQGGNQRFTTTNDIGLNTGDYVQLQGFTDPRYNGGVFKVLSSSALLNVDLDIPFNGSIVLNGAETMVHFSISLATFESGYTEEGNQYYAVNAKLNPRSIYGGNLAQYLNNSNKVNEVQFISGFEGKTTFEGYYDDISAIVDKSLTDSLATTETLALEINEKDRNGVELAAQTLNIPNQEEGVYRLPFLRGIPPFIYQLSGAAIISHLSYVRPAEFQYSPLAVDSGNTPTIQIDGTVNSARGDNYKYDGTGQTAVRDREVLGGLCLSVGVGNAGSNWDFSVLGLTGILTATVGYYETSGAAVTLDKTLTGTDPEIDNTAKTFTPQTDYKYHNLTIFEDGNVFGIYRLEQRFDEVILDASGNGNHVAGAGVTTPNDLWTIANINFSYANGDNNGFGYSLAAGSEIFDGITLTSGEIIPAITASLSVGGADLQYRSRCAIDGKLINSPAASFVIGNTLTFSNTAPYTRPGSVTIGGGTATALAYIPSTGVLEIDGAGTIEYLLVNGVNVYLCSNAGNFTIWTQNSIVYGILFSAVTWTTINNNSYLQSRGGSKYSSLITTTSYPLSSTITLTGNYRIEIVSKMNKFKFTTDPSSQLREFGISDFVSTRFFTAAGNVFYQAGGTLTNSFVQTGDSITYNVDKYLKAVLVRDGNLLVVTITDLDNSLTAIYTIADLSLTSNNNSINVTHLYSNANFAYMQNESFKIWDGASGDPIDGTGTPRNEWNPQQSLTAIRGAVNINSDNTITGYSPSALDISGNSTGLDVQGNSLSLKSGFVIQDFGNSLQVNPNNAPLLRSGFGVDDTEELTFAQIVEDVTGAGVDRYVKGGDTVEDYILVDTNIASPEDITDIQNYENR